MNQAVRIHTTKRLRERMEAAVERLIAAMDLLDAIPRTSSPKRTTAQTTLASLALAPPLTSIRSAHGGRRALSRPTSNSTVATCPKRKR